MLLTLPTLQHATLDDVSCTADKDCSCLPTNTDQSEICELSVQSTEKVKPVNVSQLHSLELLECSSLCLPIQSHAMHRSRLYITAAEWH